MVGEIDDLSAWAAWLIVDLSCNSSNSCRHCPITFRQAAFAKSGHCGLISIVHYCEARSGSDAILCVAIRGGRSLRVFLNELKELKLRNVIRVRAVYAAVSWLILQVLEILFPSFDLPYWTITLVFVVLLIGFPIAVIVA